jgi:MFS superfamily sulfate permease-like transporter
VRVGAYLVPQVMAYAEVAGLPAITGLWAAVAPLVLYPVLGSSRQLFGWTRVQHRADDRSCRRHSHVR